MGQNERPDLGAQEMVGTRGSQRCQRLQHGGVHEVQHVRRIDEMSDLALMLRNPAADLRQQPQRRGPALGLWKGAHLLATEGRLAPVVLKPHSCLVDDPERGVVTLLRAVAPGEQPVAAQDDADIARILPRHFTELDAQIDAGPLPGQEADLAAKDIPGELFGVVGGGYGDDRVRMDMIHMPVGYIAMQAGVDRRRPRIEVEDAMVQRVNHRVFLLEAGVEPLERVELVLIERGEAVELHRADVAARALDPQHRHVLARQRILCRDLGGGIAAAKIGDAQVRAQQV